MLQNIYSTLSPAEWVGLGRLVETINKLNDDKKNAKPIHEEKRGKYVVGKLHLRKLSYQLRDSNAILFILISILICL